MPLLTSVIWWARDCITLKNFLEEMQSKTKNTSESQDANFSGASLVWHWKAILRVVLGGAYELQSKIRGLFSYGVR